MGRHRERVYIPCNPLAALKTLADSPGVSLLHSGMQNYGMGRYSILAAQPWKTLSYRAGIASICEGGRQRLEKGELFATLAREFNLSKATSAFPFASGPIGYFSYDAGRYIEPSAGWRSSGGCEARFQFYDAALVFDHGDGTVYWTGAPGAARPSWLDIVCRGLVESPHPFALTSSLKANFTREEFIAAVECAREYILEGDVYQINLSQRFEAECVGSPLELYLRLAANNPAPYEAYLDFGDEQIVSTSPERFLLLENGVVRTRPIKGTRPVSCSEQKTQAYAKDLLSSEKDRSELLMIVDLERNDLGRVCRPGSVRVEGLFSVERYATVMHLTAEVVGELAEGLGPLDCIRALFPGGSITGAPKVRAMKRIAELERGPRGVYTGSIGCIDTSGRADFSIAIRSARITEGRLTYQVGGGIVWDSDPQNEYEETLWKGRALAEVLAAGASEGCGNR